MIEFNPIGIVHNDIAEAHRDTRWKEIESEIEMDGRDNFFYTLPLPQTTAKE